ncbi:MAG: hypothetical protein ACREQF_03490 [Candidatus Binataceae bacterium]
MLWYANAWASGAEGEHHGVDWSSLAFFAINFAIFLGVVIHFARPLVASFIRDRAGAIRDTIGRSQGAFSEAERLFAQARERLASLPAELEQLAADLEAETVHQVRQIANAGRTAAARIHTDAEQAAAALAEGAQRRLREQLAATSAALARELIARSFQPSDQVRLIDGFVDRLGEESRQ